MSYPTERSTQAPAGVPGRILAIQSALGLWDGSGWVKTWGEALTFPTGKDCVLAAEEVTEKSGVRAALAYAELAAGA
jgi:hypothetical protein